MSPRLNQACASADFVVIASHAGQGHSRSTSDPPSHTPAFADPPCSPSRFKSWLQSWGAGAAAGMGRGWGGRSRGAAGLCRAAVESCQRGAHDAPESLDPSREANPIAGWCAVSAGAWRFPARRAIDRIADIGRASKFLDLLFRVAHNLLLRVGCDDARSKLAWSPSSATNRTFASRSQASREHRFLLPPDSEIALHRPVNRSMNRPLLAWRWRSACKRRRKSSAAARSSAITLRSASRRGLVV